MPRECSRTSPDAGSAAARVLALAETGNSLQIGRVNGSQGFFAPTAPPYALSSPAFRFRALAALAGRAPLGGQREVALATYLAARLADDCLPQKELSATTRAERSSAARGWLASVALPPSVRSPLVKLVDATAGDPADIAPALANVITAIDSYLDAAARLELDRLVRAFASS